MNKEEKIIIKELNKIGVDTRYISLYQNTIYINNLKFSKFSRNKEELFYEKYPKINVIRSTIFQKICIKVSRTLKNQIKPRDIIYIDSTPTSENILLNILLEPYQRKYGITLTNTPCDNSIYASPKCLDQFINEYLNLMISGNKITDTCDKNTIYPLTHIYEEWITDWIESTNLKHISKKEETNPITDSMIEFLEEHIPQLKESIKQSVNYLTKENVE